MRILIIGENNESVEITRSCLCAENYITDVIFEYKQGLYLAETYTYNLIILSHLCIKNTINFCSHIREQELHTPIMIVKNDCRSSNTVQVLEYGADDCMDYPFDCGELIARIRALLRRPYKIESETITVCDLVMDTRKCTVYRNCNEIYLTRKEFLLLEHLMRNKGEVLSRDNIMDYVWSTNTNPFSNTLESHIRSLRKKIESRDTAKLIITVPGRGYKIKDLNF